MGRKRIYELAKEFKISSNAMLTILKSLQFQPKSHMSVATGVMEEAVKRKFAQEKKEAKREMEQRSAPPKPSEPSQAKRDAVRIGDIKVKDGDSAVAGIMRRIEKKQKKKERRKRKDRRRVDSAEVAKSFKSTMANLDGTKGKRRYRRGGSGSGLGDEVPENQIDVNEFMSVSELASLMDHTPAEVISKLLELGMMATINQRLDMASIETVASEFGFDAVEIAEVGEFAREDESEEDLIRRAPVVTIMGHVDHGKTSLLDYIRHSNVVGGESGAITQHIGAYEVTHGEGRIAFLDTPGHEAFTAMRARGTQSTDIVILVVAADDGVRPQTIEAIDHARAAEVPIIVAINKIDKPAALPEEVRTELGNHNLVGEDWGGDTIMVDVSAKTGEGIEKLLEMVLLQAEMMDLKADPGIRGQGSVIDAQLERGRGPVATVLVQKGTCKVGDSIVAGTLFGHIRTITNDRDQQLKTVGPSMPVQITGLHGVPAAGDSFMVVANDQEAKDISTRRSQIRREQEARHTLGRVSLEKAFDRFKEGQIKELRLIIKGDVDGSVEVLSDTLSKIVSDEVSAKVIRSGVGAVTESDVLLASASDAIIIGFHVKPDTRARDLAKTEKVEIRLYDIIYEAEEEVRKALSGMLEPSITEQFAGQAEVRNLFKVPKVGTIAGCHVTQGKITRTDQVHLVRDGTVVHKGMISSLKRFKDDAKEVNEGFECGIGVENYNDVKVGDIIEAYVLVEEARTL